MSLASALASTIGSRAVRAAVSALRENCHYVATNDEDNIIDRWIQNLTLRRPEDTQTILKIKKVPRTLQLLESNKKEYNPLVVSFGPYNHRKPEFKLAEDFKKTSLRIYASYCKKTSEDLRAKVAEVYEIAKSCYDEDSYGAYTREEFIDMMLLDACLILLLIEWLPYPDKKAMLMYEHLGAFGASNLYRDMFLLENQIPYQVLHVLSTLRFDTDDVIYGILGNFFDVLLYGKWFPRKERKVTNIEYLNLQKPLHLLEIFRDFFLLNAGIGNSFDKPHSTDSIDLQRYAHSFRSVTRFKTKGIFIRPSSAKSGANINFRPYGILGVLEVPLMVIDQDTKSVLLNLIAYEMCPSNPNDFRVTSYVRFMKSLIQNQEDVIEMRTKNVLLNSMGSDDDVATMFSDITAPPVNVLVFAELERKIHQHYNSKARTWIAELILTYFSSPWTAIAFFAAFAVIVLTAIQTFFTIHPAKE